MLYVLSQILYVVNVAFFISALLQKKKIWYVIFYMLADTLFALHYMCLEKYSALIFVLNEAVFIFIAYLIEKFGNPKYTYIAAAVVIVADIIAFIFTYTTPLTYFALFATIFACISVSIHNNMVLTKVFVLISIIFTTTYLFIVPSYVGAAFNVANIFIAIAGLIISIKHHKQQKLEKQNVLV